MANRKQYLTNAEYDEALRRFHNGLDYTEHIKYKDSILDKVDYNQDIAKEFLEEDEKTTVLERGYILTSYGRVFNIRFRRFLTPKFYNSNIYIAFSYRTYKIEDFFIEEGWAFDKIEILRRYIMNDWKRKVMDNCHYAYLAE